MGLILIIIILALLVLLDLPTYQMHFAFATNNVKSYLLYRHHERQARKLREDNQNHLHYNKQEEHSLVT